MKRNYQEMQTGTTTRGAYVDFVQTVVQLLQQYTADILPIDKFFVDSTAFPLPTTDPLYITGRLRSYQPRANDPATQKKLAMFVQTAVERAAAEQQQDYLATQLHASVEGVFDTPDTDASRPSLRKLLLEAIFPAYIDASLTQSCGDLVARPILEATLRIIADMLSSFDLADRASLKSAVASITCILTTVVNTLQAYSKLDGFSHNHMDVLNTITLFLHIATASCPLIDFALRSSVDATAAVHAINFLHKFSSGLDLLDSVRSEAARYIMIKDVCNELTQSLVLPQHSLSCSSQTLAFTKRELGFALEKNWERRPEDGRYRVLRMSAWRDVIVDIDVEDDGGLAGARRSLSESRRGFGACLRRMGALGVVVGLHEDDCGLDCTDEELAPNVDQTAKVESERPVFV